MAEPAKSLKVRTESHSDVADTPAARDLQVQHTARQFGEALVRRLRDARGELRLANFREETTPSDNGFVHEMSVEIEEGEPPA